jgi:hypothetical protein
MDHLLIESSDLEDGRPKWNWLYSQMSAPDTVCMLPVIMRLCVTLQILNERQIE